MGQLPCFIMVPKGAPSSYCYSIDIFNFDLYFYRSAGDLLTLEVYRKNSPGIKPSSSEQLNMTQLNNVPVNKNHHQQQQQFDNASTSSRSSSSSSAHVWHPVATNNKTSPSPPLPPLQIAFNKSIGGGVLV